MSRELRHARAERDSLRKALKKIVDAGDGIATINAVAEARGMLNEPTLAFGLAKVGFAVWESGGGCTAWRVPLPHGYILITDAEGASHDVTFADGCLLGIYDNDDQPIAECWQSDGRAS